MLKLGHIIYSNCFPVHAGIITKRVPFPFSLIEGIPTELNRFLYEGKLDVSPSSSIEYAMNPDKYRLLPDLSITSKGKAKSIILESRVPMADLDGKTVALTSASATSVVLLRVLLELQYGVNPNFIMYEQGVEDPFPNADAALTIGDLALKKALQSKHPHIYDLGELWREFTGLPFVFALWQVNYKKSIDKDLKKLYDILTESKAYGLANSRELAQGLAETFGLGVELLFTYWNSLSYELGEAEKKGLMTYYGYAAELGVIEKVPDLRFLEWK